MVGSCAYCERLESDDLMAENEHAAAFFDQYPRTPGHAVLASRKHEKDFFALSPEEQDAVWALLREVREHLEKEHGPDGYAVELRVGSSAGQTVMHAHVHMIPRSSGTEPFSA